MLSNLFSYVSPTKWRISKNVSPEPRSDPFGQLSDSDEEADIDGDDKTDNVDNEINVSSSYDEELYKLKCKEIEKSIDRDRQKRRKLWAKEIQEKVVKKCVEIMEKSIVKVKDKSKRKNSILASFSSSVSSLSSGRSDSPANGNTVHFQDSPSEITNQGSSSFFSGGSVTRRVATIPIDSAIYIAERYYQDDLTGGYSSIDEEMDRECESRKMKMLKELRKLAKTNYGVPRHRSSVEDSDNDDDENGLKFIVKEGEKERKLSIATAETIATIADKLSLEEARLPSIQRSDNDEDSNISRDGLDVDELRKDIAVTQLDLEQELCKVQETQGEVRAKSRQGRRKVSFSDEVEQGLSKREEIAALVSNHDDVFNAELSSDDEDDVGGKSGVDTSNINKGGHRDKYDDSRMPSL